MTAKRKDEIYHFDRLFERARRYLQGSSDVCEEDKANILRLVDVCWLGD